MKMMLIRTSLSLAVRLFAKRAVGTIGKRRSADEVTRFIEDLYGLREEVLQIRKRIVDLVRQL